MTFSRTSLFIFALLIGLFAAFGSSLLVRAQAEDVVTKEEFEQEKRLSREETYNLRQQILEQRVYFSMEELGSSSAMAQINNDPFLLMGACAEHYDAWKGYQTMWTKIREFWPLGPEKLEALEQFTKQLQQICPAFGIGRKESSE
jgi:hypothetical protein